MTTDNPIVRAGLERCLLTRRGLIKGGVGLAGVAGLMLPATGAYAAAQAARDLVITDYRLSPPTWPKGRRLTVTVIADLHASGPNMGVGRVRQVVDTGNALGSDLIVVLGDYFATHPFVTERVPPPAWAAELARLRAPLGVYAAGKIVFAADAARPEPVRELVVEPGQPKALVRRGDMHDAVL